MLRACLLYLLLVVLIACASVSCKQQTAVKHVGEMIILTDSLFVNNGCDTIRFGRMRSGEVVIKNLILHNTTGRSLALTSYTTSCGCTTLEYDSKPFGNDECAQISIAFDTRGEIGWQMKLMSIAVAPYHSDLKFYIEADVY